MSEDVFRIIVTVAVCLACAVFIVQAGIVIALYRAMRKTQGTADRLSSQLAPSIRKIEPTLDKLSVLIEQATPAFERLGPVMAKAGPTIDKIGPVLDKAAPAIEKVGPMLVEAHAMVAKAGAFVDHATELAATTNLVLADTRPNVAQFTQEAKEIARVGREQVERIGEMLHDASDKARARLEQIDRRVDSTIEHVEHATGAVKRAMMKPVREVNGVAAGISAAVSTLVSGHRRSSVDAATQDEEMFI